MHVPNEQFVVVASTSQLLVVEAPLEPTDLLLMLGVLNNNVVLDSYVSEQDSPIPRSCCDRRSVPGTCTYSACVRSKCPDELHLVRVPDLRGAVLETN